MLKLRINPIVAKDLKNIRDYIAEDNEEYAAKTIKEIYGKFENLQMFPGIESAFGRTINMRYGKIM
jgi:toxin ParE1/3/4